MFVINKMFGKEGNGQAGAPTKSSLDLHIEHPDILEYIRQNTVVPKTKLESSK